MSRTRVCLLVGLAVVACGAKSAVADAPTPAGEAWANGILWLRGVQNPSGSWGDVWFGSFRLTTEIRDTVSVVDALPDFPEKSTGLSWLAGQAIVSVDYLARVTAARVRAGEDLTSELLTLSEARRPPLTDPTLPAYPGGGWGVTSEFQSDALDTALALQTFAAAGQTSGMNEPVAFLLACQNVDGSFGLAPGEDGDLFLTLHAMLALDGYSGLSGVPAAVQSAADFVVARQEGNGEIGEDAANTTVQATALGKLALEAAGRTSEAAAAETALVNLQLVNGSWNDSAYDTALAVRVLESAATVIVVADPDPTASSGSVSGTGAYAPGDPVTLVAEGVGSPSPTLFSSWSGDLGSTDNPLTLTASGNTHLLAHFVAVSYAVDLSIAPGGNGIAAASTSDGGATVTLTAVPGTDQRLDSWEVTGSGGTTIYTQTQVTFDLTEDISVVATFVDDVPAAVPALSTWGCLALVSWLIGFGLVCILIKA